jgi:TolB-like protein/Tfp pilus assembly protein PilF
LTKSLPDSSALASGFCLGPWRVQPHRNSIIQGEEEKHLENRLMQTLVFLAEHQGVVVTREQFFETVWQGRVVNEEALSRAISLLRTALKDNSRAPKYIQTIPGVGYRLVAEVVAAGQQGESVPLTRGAQENSIAVLPFINLSEDPANEYFSDGISEEILNVLAQGDSFKVAGRTSSFVFKGRNEDLREIGKALDVAHVLEGSVRKAGAKVRITAQLIKTSDGFHLWSETFDRELEDVFAIQDDIAAAVVKALKVKLLFKKEEHTVIGGTKSTEAFEAYLKGLHYRNRGSVRETLFSARDAFQQAVTLDPDYAKAWTGLALAWCDLVWNSFVEFSDGRKRMQEAVYKAIALAPLLADGYLAKGLLLQLGMPRLQESNEALSTAIKLNPGNGTILTEYARNNCNLGNWDYSVAAAHRALELDPISVYANHVLGHILYFTRHYEEAIPALRRALELDPEYPKPHYFIAMSLHWLGDSEAALKEIMLEPLEWMKNCAAAVILYKLGRAPEAMKHLTRLVVMSEDETADIQVADVYTQMGEHDQAIECLQKALDHRDPGLPQLLVDPFLDPVREDPRFIEIYEKAGFRKD